MNSPHDRCLLHRRPLPLRAGRRVLGCVVMALATAMLSPTAWSASAQPAPARKVPPKKVQADNLPAQKAPAAKAPARKAPVEAPSSKKKKKIPDPEKITLETVDGVQLACVYYQGFLGKTAVPFILLHGWDDQQDSYNSLATNLQAVGHAVMTLDLRGHGRSTIWKGPRGRQQIDRAKMGRNLIAGMVLDVEAVKKFLMEQHNQGNLNIELLCIISADVSCTVAMNWAIKDWNAPPLPTLKQGQDVKALVLLSPKQTFRGVSAAPVFRNTSPGGAQLKGWLSVLIVVGSDDLDAYDEAERIYASFKRFRPGQPSSDPKERTLFLVKPATSLQGAKLVSTQGLTVQRDIATFIKLRLVDRQVDLPWKDRSNLLGN